MHESRERILASLQGLSDLAVRNRIVRATAALFQEVFKGDIRSAEYIFSPPESKRTDQEIWFDIFRNALFSTWEEAQSDAEIEREYFEERLLVLDECLSHLDLTNDEYAALVGFLTIESEA